MPDQADRAPAAIWPRDAEPAHVLEALSAALFDANLDLVWDLDLGGRVERVNARVRPILGYEPADLRGRPLSDVVVAEDLPEVEAAFRAALAGRTETCTCRMRHRDGHLVAVRAVVIPLVVRGVVRRVYAGCRDVTAALAAREALAEREALYAVLVEQSPECVCIYQDERCAYVNPAGAHMRGPGVAPADVVGAHWVRYDHPDDRARVDAELRALLAAPLGTTRPLDQRFVWPDGRVIEVEGVGTTVTYRGRPAVHNFARDVTARRRADAERLRGQRFEALGRLAAGVAHDFNNLLAVMLGALELAAEAVPPGDPLRDDLTDAMTAARRGRSLTRQLLTFARREVTEPRAVDVNQLVRGMQELLRRVAGPRVQLDLALAPEPGVVLADPAQAEQALLNLVTNARDAMPGGGRITIETARENGDLRVTVRDTGVGIPPEVRPQLFEPFFTTKAEGTGLGLATVYGVVTGAGGRVEVESEPGRGAAFHLLLPRAPEAGAADAGAAEGAGAPGERPAR
jgi:PAS domain S-box-containing protein